MNPIRKILGTVNLGIFNGLRQFTGDPEDKKSIGYKSDLGLWVAPWDNRRRLQEEMRKCMF